MLSCLQRYHLSVSAQSYFLVYESRRALNVGALGNLSLKILYAQAVPPAMDTLVSEFLSYVHQANQM